MTNENNKNAADYIPVEKLNNYEAMKEYLTVRVIGQENNQDFLATAPHKNMEDMAVTYAFDFGETPMGNASIKITNQMLDAYGVSAEQLHLDAVSQAAINHPATIRNMSDVIADNFGGMFAMEPSPLFVATNDVMLHGASVIAYQDFMDQAAKQMDGNFYLLPSSLHEVILISDQEGLTPAELKQMVTDINGSEVHPEDRLTDNAYHYDADERIFEQVSSFEKRMADRATEKSSVLADLGSKQRECAARPPKEKTSPKKSEPEL